MRRSFASLRTVGLLAIIAGCASPDQPTSSVTAVNVSAAARSPDADAEAQLRSLSHVNSSLSRIVVNVSDIHAVFIPAGPPLAPATTAELTTLRDQAMRLAALVDDMLLRSR